MVARENQRFSLEECYAFFKCLDRRGSYPKGRLERCFVEEDKSVFGFECIMKKIERVVKATLFFIFFQILVFFSENICYNYLNI